VPRARTRLANGSPEEHPRLANGSPEEHLSPNVQMRPVRNVSKPATARSG
jgi:hypothetical protein